MPRARTFRLSIIALAILALGPAALAGPARFTTINYPDALATYAYGINPEGDIVGSFLDQAKVEHGFLLHQGHFTRLDFPGSAWTQAWGISPEGAIVGQYGLPNSGAIHGFLLLADDFDTPADGNFYPISVTGQPNTMPFGISPDGAIVGCVHGNPLTGMHGFEMTADGVTLYGNPGVMHTGINPQGDIVGYFSDPGGHDYSYLVSNGLTTTFTVDNAVFTRARGINARGEIVGIFQDATTHMFHGFLLRQGKTTTIDVNLPGVSLTRAFGINAEGDIVGYYRDSTGFHAFLLSRGDDDED